MIMRAQAFTEKRQTFASAQLLLDLIVADGVGGTGHIGFAYVGQGMSDTRAI